MSKLKPFNFDDNLNMVQIVTKFVFDRVENIVQCFQKASSSWLLQFGIVG